MVPSCLKCSTSLEEIKHKRELLRESVNECILARDFYICRNERNENELKRLVLIKENLTYLKDVLLQDLYKSNVNAGKRKKLLNKKLEEFQEKDYSVKPHLENRAGVSQLKELIQFNEQLITEHLRWTKMLQTIKEEYSQLICDLENNLKMKIIEFSQELSQLRQIEWT